MQQAPEGACKSNQESTPPGTSSIYRETRVKLTIGGLLKMKFSLSQIRKMSLGLSAVIIAFSAGWWANENNIRFGLKPQPASPLGLSTEGRADLSLFWKVWDSLDAEYFDKSKLNSREMVYGAIKGMVSAVGDPYTVFLPPSEQKRTQEDLEGEFEGIGIQIGFKGSQLAVIAPLDGSPAEAAGIKAGDFIVGIKDKNKDIDRGTVGIPLHEAVEAIRGPAGTSVILTLTRKGEEKPLEVEIARKRIEVPSVELSLKDGIAHLKLLRFGGNTEREWDRAVDKIASGQARKVVLDLRNNPGGFLSGAVSIVSEFLEQGVVVVQESGSGKRNEFKADGRPRLAKIPLVVLVNGGSASASEIVAGALKDQNRAKIIGEKTFGKGTIQESLSFDSSGLHITTDRWLTPKGTWVNDKEGLEPDIVIEDNQSTEADEQLEGAIRELAR